MPAAVTTSLLFHGDVTQQNFTLRAGGEQKGVVTEFRVEHHEGRHDLATVSARGLPVDFLATQLDLPCTFQWRAPSGYSETLHGFAKVVTPTAHRMTPGTQATVRIFGTTYAMREGSGRSWSDIYHHEVARSIVEKYQFGLEWDADKLWRRTVMQADQSDWQLLAELAEDLGFCLTNDNAVVRFIDPFEEFTRLPLYNGTLVLKLPPAPGANVSEYSVDMASIKPYPTRHWQLQIAPPNTAVTTTFRTEWEEPAVHFPLQGNVIGQNGPTKFRSGTFPSWAAARQFAQAEVRRNTWTHWMNVTAQIDPRYKVGTLVYVDDAKGQYSGHWFVVEVKHQLSVVSSASTKALSTLRLKRAVHGRERVFVGGTRPAPARPKTVLANGVWRTEREWMKAVS